MSKDPEGLPARPLLILGAGTFAAEIADLVSEVPGYQLAGFVENLEPARARGTLEGLPVYHMEDVAGMAATHWAVCAVGTTHRARFIDQAAPCGIPFATILHPAARVSSRSTVGDGCIVSAGVIVGARTTLGRHVILNRGALIGHHTGIEDYVTVGPGANIAASCRVGEASYIGMGAIVLDHITIGAHSVVGAGAVVTKDVPDNVQVIGVPARIVKRDIAGK